MPSRFASHHGRVVLVAAGLSVLAACQSRGDIGTAERPSGQISGARLPLGGDPIARGRQALAAGRYVTARNAYTAALKADPDSADASIGLGEAYLALGDAAKAARCFEIAASASGRDDPRVLQGMGLVALYQGRTEDAVSLLRRAVGRDPSAWHAWVGLGRAYAEERRQEEARAAFARAGDVAPRRAEVLNDLGMSYLTQNDPKRALTQFEQALSLDPGLAVARANARIARAMLGEYDVAVSGATPEELPDVLNNAGYAAILRGDYEVADRLLRRALAISPVYHEAASANLDLLAEAMRGDSAGPVLASAAPGGDGPELGEVTAHLARAESVPAPRRAGSPMSEVALPKPAGGASQASRRGGAVSANPRISARPDVGDAGSTIGAAVARPESRSEALGPLPPDTRTSSGAGGGRSTDSARRHREIASAPTILRDGFHWQSAPADLSEDRLFASRRTGSEPVASRPSQASGAGRPPIPAEERPSFIWALPPPGGWGSADTDPLDLMMATRIAGSFQAAIAPASGG